MVFSFDLILCVEDKLLLVRDNETLYKKDAGSGSHSRRAQERVVQGRFIKGKFVKDLNGQFFRKTFSTLQIDKLKREQKEEIKEKKIAGIAQEALKALKKLHVRQVRKKQLVEINRLFMSIAYAARHNFAVGDLSSSISKISKYKAKALKFFEYQRKNSKRGIDFLLWSETSRKNHLEMMLKLVEIIRKQALQLFPVQGCKNLLIEVERGAEGVKRLIQICLKNPEQQESRSAFKMKALGLSTTFHPDLQADLIVEAPTKRVSRTLLTHREQQVLWPLDRAASLIERRQSSEELTEKEELLIQKEKLLRASAFFVCKKRQALGEKRACERRRKQLLKKLRAVEAKHPPLPVPLQPFRIKSEEYSDLESCSESESEAQKSEAVSSTEIHPLITAIQPRVTPLIIKKSQILGKRKFEISKRIVSNKKKKKSSEIEKKTSSSIEFSHSFGLLAPDHIDIEESADEEELGSIDANSPLLFSPVISAIQPQVLSSPDILSKRKASNSEDGDVERKRRKQEVSTDSSDVAEVLSKGELRKDSLEDAATRSTQPLVLPFFYIRRYLVSNVVSFVFSYTVVSGSGVGSKSYAVKRLKDVLKHNLACIKEIAISQPFFDWKEPFSLESKNNIERSDALHLMLQGLKDNKAYLQQNHSDIIMRLESNNELDESILCIEKIYKVESSFQRSDILEKLVKIKFQELEGKETTKSLEERRFYHMPIFRIYRRGHVFYMGYTVRESNFAKNFYVEIRNACTNTFAHIRSFLEKYPAVVISANLGEEQSRDCREKESWPIILQGLKETHAYLQQRYPEIIKRAIKSDLKQGFQTVIEQVENHVRAHNLPIISVNMMAKTLEIYEKRKSQQTTTEKASTSQKKVVTSKPLAHAQSVANQILVRPLKEKAKLSVDVVFPFFGVQKVVSRYGNAYKIGYFIKTAQQNKNLRDKSTTVIIHAVDLVKVLIEREKKSSSEVSLDEELLYERELIRWNPLGSKNVQGEITRRQALELILEGFQETLAYAQRPVLDRARITINDRARKAIQACVVELEELVGKRDFSPSDVLESVIEDFLKQKEMKSRSFCDGEGKGPESQKISLIKETEKSAVASLLPKIIVLPFFYIRKARYSRDTRYMIGYSSLVGMSSCTITHIPSKIKEIIQNNVIYLKEIMATEVSIYWKEPFSKVSAINIQREDALQLLLQGLKENQAYLLKHHAKVIRGIKGAVSNIDDALKIIKAQFKIEPSFVLSETLGKIEEAKRKECLEEKERLMAPKRRSLYYCPIFILYPRGVNYYMECSIKERAQYNLLCNVLRTTLSKTLTRVQELMKNAPFNIIWKRLDQEDIGCRSKQFWPVILNGLKENREYFLKNVPEIFNKGRVSLEKLLEETICQLEELILELKCDQEECPRKMFEEALKAYEEKRLTAEEVAAQPSTSSQQQVKKTEKEKAKEFVIANQILSKPLLVRQHAEKLSIIPFFFIYRETMFLNRYNIAYRIKISASVKDNRSKTSAAINKGISIVEMLMYYEELITTRERLSLLRGPIEICWEDPLTKIRKIFSLKDALPIILEGFKETLAYAKRDSFSKHTLPINEKTQKALEAVINKIENVIGVKSFIASDLLDKLILEQMKSDQDRDSDDESN